METACKQSKGAPTVTVIVAAYQSRERIRRVVEALRNQTLAADRYDVLVVVNGPDDGTMSLLEGIKGESKDFNLRVVRTLEGNASVAWNIGLDLAVGEYVTFVDDDDWVSAKYLEILTARADRDRIVLAPFGNITPGQTSAQFDNYLNRALFKFAGLETTLGNLPQAASANCGKIIHRDRIGSTRFDVTLRSGMDIAFWSTVIARNKLRLFVLPPLSGAVYFREMRDGSMSRVMSDQFALDRIRVISELARLRESYSDYATPLNHLMRAQAGHLGKFIAAHPDRERWVRGKIKAVGLDQFPYDAMNQEASRTLVIAYAFPPYLDTSALVVARRLNSAGKSFDVVTQDMSNIRDTDLRSQELVREYLGRRFVLPSPATFGNWNLIQTFLARGALVVEEHLRRRSSYEEIYSRSMFPASHLLAALLKVRHPELYWVAEFSDPMRHDVLGRARVTEMGESVELEEIRQGLVSRHPSLRSDRNLWSWAEDVCFALADKILFTNGNQQELMIRCAPEAFQQRIREIGEVSPHPTLPETFYRLEESNYVLPEDRINIGYFGVFYPSRGIGELAQAFRAIPDEFRRLCQLHIFTDKPEDYRGEIEDLIRSGQLRLSGYVPYFEFLNLASRLDWLVVADARASEVHGINPYLPSKYSDYLGSGTRILGLVEPGSALDERPLAAKVALGNVEGLVEVLLSIIQDGALPTNGKQ